MELGLGATVGGKLSGVCHSSCVTSSIILTCPLPSLQHRAPNTCVSSPKGLRFPR